MDEWCFRSLLEFKEIVGKKKDWVGTKFWVNTNFGSQKFVSQNVLKKREGWLRWPERILHSKSFEKIVVVVEVGWLSRTV